MEQTDFSPTQSKLAEWFLREARNLPWRNTYDAYHIWLSEVILQQTRVEQGRAYYERFLSKWPSISDLADASEDEVLKMWQGLGYYSRARNLLKTARVVANQHKGNFPADLKNILALPGIGPYTGRAILSFAYNLPFATVDGNIYRVLSRLFGISTPINTPNGVKEFQNIANQLLDRENSRVHNQALMELGSQVCTPTHPSCPDCPIAGECFAHLHDCQLQYPIKNPKTPLVDKALLYIDIFGVNGESIMFRRKSGDIWQGLYEPILFTYDQAQFPDVMLAEDMEVQALIRSLNLMRPTILPALQKKHILSHRRLYATYFKIEAKNSLSLPKRMVEKGYQIVTKDERETLGTSRLIEIFYHENGSSEEKLF